MWFELGILFFRKKRVEKDTDGKFSSKFSKIILEHEIVHAENGLRNLARCRARINAAYADNKGAFRFSKKKSVKKSLKKFGKLFENFVGPLNYLTTINREQPSLPLPYKTSSSTESKVYCSSPTEKPECRN